MRNAEIPCDVAARSVITITTNKSAACELVVKHLFPLRIQDSPSRIPELRVPPASDPDSGSVSAQAPIHSPDASFGM